MDIGTILTMIVGGFLLLVVLFLPLITRSSAKPRTNSNDDRENAYRRGLMIGSLMEEMHEMQQDNQQQHMEQKMIELFMIEHSQHHHALGNTASDTFPGSGIGGEQQ